MHKPHIKKDKAKAGGSGWGKRISHITKFRLVIKRRLTALENAEHEREYGARVCGCTRRNTPRW